MQRFVQRQCQSSHQVRPARPNRATPQAAHAKNPLLAQQQTLGNQTVQRLLQAKVVQAKLKIGQPGDKYEQEADRVAEQVMRMPEPKTSQRATVGGQAPDMRIQRLCPECEEEVHRQPMEEEEEEETLQTKPLADQITPLVQRQIEPEEEEEEEEEASLQAKLADGALLQRQEKEPEEEEEEPIQTKLAKGVQVQRREEEPEKEEEEPIQTKRIDNQTPRGRSDLADQIRSLKGSGQPLPQSTCDFFEPRFGHDFGQIRVHTDDQAAETARAVNARAFTVGRDVVFGAGQYKPGTEAGRQLIAHELTHTIQQKKESHYRVQRQGGSRRKARSWLSRRGFRKRDGNFPFQLVTWRLPCSCGNLLWEQFGAGGFTLYGPKRRGKPRESRKYDIFANRKKPILGPPLKKYGGYVQDWLPGMKRGPNPVNSSPADAKCRRGRYIFNDAPGWAMDFGTIKNDLLFDGISWEAKFIQKLWCAGEKQPFLIRNFRLVGSYYRGGRDRRRLLPR